MKRQVVSKKSRAQSRLRLACHHDSLTPLCAHRILKHIERVFISVTLNASGVTFAKPDREAWQRELADLFRRRKVLAHAARPNQHDSVQAVGMRCTGGNAAPGASTNAVGGHWRALTAFRARLPATMTRATCKMHRVRVRKTTPT